MNTSICISGLRVHRICIPIAGWTVNMQGGELSLTVEVLSASSLFTAGSRNGNQVMVKLVKRPSWEGYKASTEIRTATGQCIYSFIYNTWYVSATAKHRKQPCIACACPGRLQMKPVHSIHPHREVPIHIISETLSRFTITTRSIVGCLDMRTATI